MWYKIWLKLSTTHDDLTVISVTKTWHECRLLKLKTGLGDGEVIQLPKRTMLKNEKATSTWKSFSFHGELSSSKYKNHIKERNNIITIYGKVQLWLYTQISNLFVDFSYKVFNSFGVTIFILLIVGFLICNFLFIWAS